MLPDPDHHPEIYAGVASKRLIAWGLDVALIFGLTLVAVPLTAFTGLFFFPLLYAVISFCYRVITLANGSATLGMRLMSIEIRQADDRPLDLPTATFHTTGYFLCMAFFLAQIASVVLMATGARVQGLPDRALGTAAMNRRRRR